MVFTVANIRNVRVDITMSFRFSLRNTRTINCHIQFRVLRQQIKKKIPSGFLYSTTHFIEWCAYTIASASATLVCTDERVMTWSAHSWKRIFSEIRSQPANSTHTLHTTVHTERYTTLFMCKKWVQRSIHLQCTCSALFSIVIFHLFFVPFRERSH